MIMLIVLARWRAARASARRAAERLRVPDPGPTPASRPGVLCGVCGGLGCSWCQHTGWS